MNFVAPRSGVRLDKLIAEATGCGRRKAAEWIRSGIVRVDGRAAVASARVGRGQAVRLEEPVSPLPEPAAPEPVRILLQRGELLALAKPAGLHTQRGRRGGSVAEFLEHRFEGISEVGARPEEAGTVHRLDRDTSGVLLAATTPSEYRRIRAMFSSGQVRKEYLALAGGIVAGRLVLDQPLARRTSRVAPAGRHDRALLAHTEVAPLEVGADWSLVHVRMSTGVTHQVRAHMALAGHPLLGDVLYGGAAIPACDRGRRGHLLHALRICVGDELDVTAAPAADFVAVYAMLKARSRAVRPSGPAR